MNTLILLSFQEQNIQLFHKLYIGIYYNKLNSRNPPILCIHQCLSLYFPVSNHGKSLSTGHEYTLMHLKCKPHRNILNFLKILILQINTEFVFIVNLLTHLQPYILSLNKGFLGFKRKRKIEQ